MSGLAVIQANPLGLLVAFGAGMLSFLSPCVLPLVPAYLSMVSGLSAAELGALSAPGEPVATVTSAASVAPVTSGASVAPVTSLRSVTSVSSGVSVAPVTPPVAAVRASVVRGVLGFIAGFTVIFTILGASASTLGRLLLTHQRALETVSGILIVVFGALLIAMATGVALPMALAGEHRITVRPSVLGAWAPPVMGMAFAFAWTPCIGPVLGSVLTLAAGTGGSTTGGIALLLAYSLGIGVPFLISGLAFGRMTSLLARARGKLRLVDLAGGAVLVMFGFLLLTGHVSALSDVISSWLRDLHLERLSTS